MSISKENLEEFLKDFYLRYDINIEFKDGALEKLASEINEEQTEEYKFTQIVSFIKDTIRNYQSNFANMDEIEYKMFQLKERQFLEMTNPKHFWVTFMEGKAAQNM